MPPTSVNIFGEGAVMSFKIVNGGIFDRKGLVEYMIDKPGQYPEKPALFSSVSTLLFKQGDCAALP
jgi:hypothetical protein